MKKHKFEQERTLQFDFKAQLPNEIPIAEDLRKTHKIQKHKSVIDRRQIFEFWPFGAFVKQVLL